MNKNKTPTCGFCGRNLHCQLLSGCITDAFCFGCKRDIPLDAITFIEDPQKAISVKQPWAYLICAGIKDIENRTWPLPEKYKGERVFIHASAKPDKEPYMIFTDEQASLFIETDLDYIMLQSYSQTSQIIGSVRFVDCVINNPSIWAEKSPMENKDGKEFLIGKPIYNWIVADPILFDEPIIEVKGKLSFWDCSNYLNETAI